MSIRRTTFLRTFMHDLLPVQPQPEAKEQNPKFISGLNALRFQVDKLFGKQICDQQFDEKDKNFLAELSLAYMDRVKSYSKLRLIISYLISCQEYCVPSKSSSKSHWLDYSQALVMDFFDKFKDKLQAPLNYDSECLDLGKKVWGYYHYCYSNGVYFDPQNPLISVAALLVKTQDDYEECLQKMTDEDLRLFQQEIQKHENEADLEMRQMLTEIAADISTILAFAPANPKPAKQDQQSQVQAEQEHQSQQAEKRLRNNRPQLEQSHKKVKPKTDSLAWRSLALKGFISGAVAIAITALILANSWNPIGWFGVAALGLISLGSFIKAHQKSTQMSRSVDAIPALSTTAELGARIGGRKLVVSVLPSPVTPSSIAVATSSRHTLSRDPVEFSPQTLRSLDSGLRRNDEEALSFSLPSLR